MKNTALTAHNGDTFRTCTGYDAAGRRASTATRDDNAATSCDDLDRLTAACSAFQAKPGSAITHAMRTVRADNIEADSKEIIMLSPKRRLREGDNNGDCHCYFRAW